MTELKPAAFMSYVHADDKYGHLTQQGGNQDRRQPHAAPQPYQEEPWLSNVYSRWRRGNH